MERLDKSELIFKIIAYTLVTLFAVCCLYPLVYALSCSISSKDAYEAGKVIWRPVSLDFSAMEVALSNKEFWISYTNTLFYTFYGTIYSMVVSITGSYALSKDKLLWKRTWNFLLVFTMWFSAGMIPTWLNYTALGVNNRWGIVACLGMNAFNMILLRNGFNGVPKEIEEAAIVDGANEFQILTRIYIPMSKSTIATVTLFYALSRWNGYFWAKQLLRDKYDRPLQVFLRTELDNIENAKDVATVDTKYNTDSYIYALIVLSIIPIICVYPIMQKYFAAGVNVGGVKE